MNTLFSTVSLLATGMFMAAMSDAKATVDNERSPMHDANQGSKLGQFSGVWKVTGEAKIVFRGRTVKGGFLWIYRLEVTKGKEVLGLLWVRGHTGLGDLAKGDKFRFKESFELNHSEDFNGSFASTDDIKMLLKANKDAR